MPAKWQNDSEVVAGLVLHDKLSADAVNPNLLMPPYNEIVMMKRKGLSPSEMVISGIPFTNLDGAMLAGEKISAESSVNWLRVLEVTASRAIGGARLRKQADALERGEEADTGIILQVASSIENGYHELTPMSEVEPAGNMFIETGYDPIDKYFGGLPMASMTILAASPGVGKTTLGLKVAISFARKYKEKKVAIFTLEMLMSQITKRALELDKKLSKAERSRILLSEEILGPHEVYAIASRAVASEDIGLILIDFADQMVEGEQSESIMGVIYKQMASLAKRSGVPVLLIAQLNRETYIGGIPKINHIRYSGLAEAAAAMILLVYNPHNIFVDGKSNEILPSLGNVGYLIIGKSRYGYKQGGPGAVQIGWDGQGGWDDKPMGWFSLG